MGLYDICHLKISQMLRLCSFEPVLLFCLKKKVARDICIEKHLRDEIIVIQNCIARDLM